MKSMNRKEGKKIAVMAAVIMGFMMFAFMPMASAGVTFFTVTPNTGIAGAVGSYDAYVITDGVTSIDITIPAGFIAVAPTTSGVEIARFEFFNSSTKAYYGHAIITANNANPTTEVDIYWELGGDAITTTQDVDYAAGATNRFKSCFGDGSFAIIKLPTEDDEGSIKITINSTTFLLDAVMTSIKQFVRNPLTADDYVFSANGETATVEIIARKVYLKRYRDAAWYIDTDGDLTPDWSFYFAFTATDKPVVGDINRDVSDDIAFFHEGAWYVNTNPSGGPPFLIDLSFWFGYDGETPVVGDINQDGVDDVARFKDGAWYVDLDGGPPFTADWSFWYGYPGDTPLVGDINQDGKDDIAYFHQGAWYVTTDTTGGPPFVPDLIFWYGYPGDKPVVGDFDYDGLDDIARFRYGAWYIDTNFDLTPDISVWYGYPGDTPVGGGEL